MESRDQQVQPILSLISCALKLRKEIHGAMRRLLRRPSGSPSHRPIMIAVGVAVAFPIGSLLLYVHSACDDAIDEMMSSRAFRPSDGIYAGTDFVHIGDRFDLTGLSAFLENREYSKIARKPSGYFKVKGDSREKFPSRLAQAHQQPAVVAGSREDRNG